MNRIAFCVLASGLAGIMALGAEKLSLSRSSLRKPPSLSDLMIIPPASLPRQHLYSGHISLPGQDPLFLLDSGAELPLANGLDPESAYFKGRDHSTDDVQYAPDGIHRLSTQSYYPRRGELFRRPHVKTTYDGKTDAVLEEDVRYSSGTRKKWTRFDDKGAKHITEYAENGITELSDAEFTPQQPYQVPELKYERRWRNDEAHSLAYSDTLNDDGTRTIVSLDTHGLPLRIENWAKFHSAVGTTVTVYDPVTHKISMVSKTDSDFDTADFKGPDGKRLYTLKLGPGSIDVIYYDSKGEKPLLEQNYMHIIQYKNGVSQASDVISDLTEFDAAGVKTRSLDYDADGKVVYEDRFNLTVAGVTYQHAMFAYDEGGFLHHVSYFLKEGLDNLISGPNLEQDYTPKDNIRLVLPPADELVLKVKLETEGLPIPPPRGGEM